ncbi:MAG: glycerophosphodiester phosphodiesterase [Oscillibacter sp.]|nr:glycerophosphodiester phosphodiesterase [Oscillibacter sp.]
MELSIRILEAAAVLVLGLRLMPLLPAAVFLPLCLLSVPLMGKLSLFLLIPCFAWWFLVHGRRGAPGWAALNGVRFAHRGLHEKPRIPENSLSAFRRAARRHLGAELDVHLTQDGRLAVIHDSALARTCGAMGSVEDCTAGELASLRLEGTEQRIPFLEEVLPIFEGGPPLIVEVKTARGNWRELTRRTAACLDCFDVRYCVESFDPRVLVWLRFRRPEILRGQLSQNFLRRPSGCGSAADWALTNLLPNFLTRPDFIAYRFEDRRSPSRTLCCRRWGVRAFYWTIRSPADLSLAEAEGAAGIFENFDLEAEHEKNKAGKAMAEENL